MHLVTQDRTDYRCMSNARLIQESKDNPTTELAIALGERIEDAIFEDASWEETARACEDENEKLGDEISTLKAQIEELELMLGMRDEQINDLQNTAEDWQARYQRAIGNTY